MSNQSLRILLISDFNIDVMRGYLQNTSLFPSTEALTVPFGQVMPMLINRDHPLWVEPLDCAVVWTQPQRVIPAFADILNFKNVALSTVIEQVHEFADLIAQVADKAGIFFVPVWDIPSYIRGYGVLDMRDPFGVRYVLSKMNMEMAQRLSQIKNIYLLDSRLWLAGQGEDAFSPALWYLSKIPFHQEVFKKAALDILTILKNIYGGAKKIIVIDLDDTLWGGIVGEIGWQNIRLGGHDALGEAFRDFQASLKSLQQRGILLAVISKNDQAVVHETFMRHPEMVLKIQDFAAMRVNWKDKAENLIEIIQELNLSLSAAVFIDDSPAERLRIKEAFPEVFVPAWPQDKFLYKKTLMELSCFDTLTITQEDAQRAKLYAQEKERVSLKQSLGSLNDWVKALDIALVVERLNEEDLSRAVQLLNKTNQMNLSTRRMLEKDFWAWVCQEGHFVWTLRVKDKFGDYGLTAIVSLAVNNSVGQICDFVLSCRVIGRKVEEAMLAIVIEQARELGIQQLRAEYIPTDRNKPCWEFLNSSALSREGNLFFWDGPKPYPYPQELNIGVKAKATV